MQDPYAGRASIGSNVTYIEQIEASSLLKCSCRMLHSLMDGSITAPYSLQPRREWTW